MTTPRLSEAQLAGGLPLRRASLRLESAPVCFCDGMFRTGGVVGDQPFWRLAEATASGSYAQAGVGVLRLSASGDVVVAPAGRASAARSTPGCERGPVDRGRAAPLPTGTRCSRGKHEPAVAGPACWNPVERRRARRAGPQGKSESAVDLVAAARSAGTRCCPAVGSAGGCWAPRVGDRGGNFVVFGACVAPLPRRPAIARSGQAPHAGGRPRRDTMGVAIES
jgi:hypothetical protein